MVQVRMVGFKKLNMSKNSNDLMHVIEKDDSNSSFTTESDDKRILRTCRERVAKFMDTKKVHIAIIIIVLVDCALVVIELLINLKILEMGNDKLGMVPQIVHFLNISILCVFVIEIVIRIVGMGLNFFCHKWEVLDGVVVILALALDIAFAKEEGLKSVIGLIIVLRMWRISKVINSVVATVRRQAERRLLRERRTREALEQELAKYREYCSAQEFEIECLQGLLRKHGVDYVQVERPVMGQQIDVVVEVNEILLSESRLMQGSPNSTIVMDTST